MDRRKQFTFYASYYDAVKKLSKKDQLSLLMAICAYAIDGVDSNLSGGAASAFILIKPTLDASRRKAESGKRGGNIKQTESKPKANDKQTAKCDKQNEANCKQSVSEKEKEKEIEKENEIEEEKEKESSISPPPVPPSRGEPGKREEDALSGLSGPLREKLQVWLDYKRERRESYKPTGLSALVSKVSVSAEKYGNQAVMDLIDQAMSCGYKGIPFDRLAQKNPGMIQQPEKREPGEFERRAIQRMMEWGAQHAE